jgi:hypothetical protein
LPCCRHCLPRGVSLVSVFVITSLRYRICLLTSLSLWEILGFRRPSCLVVFGIFLSAWGSKICFSYSDSTQGLAAIVRTSVLFLSGR